MPIIAETRNNSWFDGLTMTGHPELVEGCRNGYVKNYVVIYNILKLIKISNNFEKI